jgi:uncharacterized damage-inducible protein DinB
MADGRESLALEPIGDDALVGGWLAAMEDARRRTLRELDGLTDDALERRPVPLLGTIGQLLYHIGLIEADWLLSDILCLPDGQWPAWIGDEFPIDVRDEAGRLSEVPPEPLSRHVERLGRVRALLLESLQSMTAAEFVRPRKREHMDVTPAWTLHHLLQHEAEHRAQIALVRDMRS